MQDPNQLFALFAFAILILRVALFVHPVPSPTIGGFRLHHWMYGVILVVIAVALSNRSIYAIGLGLFIDETTFILINGRSHQDNFSFVSLIGTALFITVTYLLRSHIFW